MRFLTVEQMRAADREASVQGITLMTRAGAELARIAGKLALLRGSRRVVLIAGHGDNGGDACVAARYLHMDGFCVTLLLICPPERLRGDARRAWDKMCAYGVPYRVLVTADDWASYIQLRGGVIVDGVLGTGCRGAPTSTAEQAILWINRMRHRTPIVSVDIPSGMNGDTGEVAGAAVYADITVTFIRPKRCFLNERAAERVGHLVVADIGMPDVLCDLGAEEDPCQLITLPELSRGFVRRAWDAHKGQFGRLCVVGGSAGLPHAPVLAALGAVRSGAGLVTLAVPAASAAAAAVWVPEAMVFALDTPQGDLSAAAFQAWGRALAEFDALVVGPGLGTSERASGLVAHLLAAYDGKVVLDADGLNALAALRGAGEWRPRENQRLLITPHPGEAARLLGVPTDAVQADRLGAVKELAEVFQATVMLKGSGSLVCAPGGVPRLNRTGNPGMARGGMGDILAGMAGALWVQGLDAADAAATAVWAHGAAGDFAVFAGSRTALNAAALVQQLGFVFQMLE